MKSSPSAAVPLSLYIVSEDRIDGGRFIDTSDFPKLGYIAATPDLVIMRLADVYPSEPSGSMINGKDAPPPAERSALVILLHPDDSQKLSALSKRAIGKRLLMMLGEKPLEAPAINSVLSTQSVLLEFPTTESQKMQMELKKLVQ